MMLKRNAVPLPDFAPVTRKAGLTQEVADMGVGDSGIVAYAVGVVRQTCKRVTAQAADAGEIRYYAVWPSNSDGSALETGHDFALVARITAEQAAAYEAQRAGSVISGRVS